MGAEGEVVGYERMHPVHGDELLGERVGRPWWSGGEPMMPLQMSSSPKRPRLVVIFSPRRPHQLPRIATWIVGWATIAGVHSTVWILAMSAAFTRRAVWNRTLVVPVRVLAGQPVADGVVLEREDGVEHAEADPPVVVEAGDLGRRSGRGAGRHRRGAFLRSSCAGTRVAASLAP